MLKALSLALKAAMGSRECHLGQDAHSLHQRLLANSPKLPNTSGPNHMQFHHSGGNKIIAFILAFSFAWSASQIHAQNEAVSARCVGVHDGDSITVLTAGNVQLKVRLEGIDAPELKQPFSQQSKEALSGLVFGKDVTLIKRGSKV